MIAGARLAHGATEERQRWQVGEDAGCGGRWWEGPERDEIIQQGLRNAERLASIRDELVAFGWACDAGVIARICR